MESATSGPRLMLSSFLACIKTATMFESYGHEIDHPYLTIGPEIPSAVFPAEPRGSKGRIHVSFVLPGFTHIQQLNNYTLKHD